MHRGNENAPEKVIGGGDELLKASDTSGRVVGKKRNAAIKKIKTTTLHLFLHLSISRGPKRQLEVMFPCEVKCLTGKRPGEDQKHQLGSIINNAVKWGSNTRGFPLPLQPNVCAWLRASVRA